jgi:hypothetical protein
MAVDFEGEHYQPDNLHPRSGPVGIWVGACGLDAGADRPPGAHPDQLAPRTQNARICTASTLSSIEATSAPNGGDARVSQEQR